MIVTVIENKGYFLVGHNIMVLRAECEENLVKQNTKQKSKHLDKQD